MDAVVKQEFHNIFKLFLRTVYRTSSCPVRVLLFTCYIIQYLIHLLCTTN